MRIRAAAVLLCWGLLTACAEQPAVPAAEGSASATDAAATGTDRPAAEPSIPPSSPRPPPDEGSRVVAAASDFGTILFDDTGQAIYMFDVEATSRPRCYGSCADAWPPVLTIGDPVAGRQVDATLLGTTRRTDGTNQVTYGGHPLYFYAHEGKHEVECHDVFLNGGTWYALQPDGRPAP